MTVSTTALPSDSEKRPLLDPSCNAPINHGGPTSPIYVDDFGDGNVGEILAQSLLFPEATRPPAKSKFQVGYHEKYVPSFSTGVKGLLVLLQSPVLLMLIGAFAALSTIIVDSVIISAVDLRKTLAETHFLLLLAFSVASAASAAIIISFLSPKAAGSGLPEIKVAISGIPMKQYLSRRVLLAKSVGLVAAYAAGLSIGKEGPLIMISCAFTNLLMKAQAFKRIKEDSSKRLEMLACACAAAVAATFGTPFGGVLFSVEVTSTFYMVRNLPRSFFAAIFGSVVMTLVGGYYNSQLLNQSTLGIEESSTTNNNNLQRRATVTDVIIFSLVGFFCGILGSLFIKIISVLVELRNWYLDNDQKIHRRRVLLVVCVSAFAIIVEYIGDSNWFFEMGSQTQLLRSVFTPSNDAQQDAAFYNHLFYYTPLKFCLTALCVVLPIPCGIFAPTFLIGGLVGRLAGVFIHLHFPGVTEFYPFEFAIIGAGAFSSGVTRAVSTAVIVMELCHNASISLPVSVAILAAYFTGGRFNENVYDVLISTNHLPRLKKLPKAAFDIPSWEVMKEIRHFKILSADCTYREAQAVLDASMEPIFPIVDNATNMLLLGAVSRHNLKSAVKYCRLKVSAMSKGGLNQNDNTVVALSHRRSRLKSFHSSALITNSEGKKPSRSLSYSEHQPSQLHRNDGTGLFDWPIQFAIARAGKYIRWGSQSEIPRTKLTVIVNPSPFQIVEAMSMQKVDTVFRMLKVSNAFVTRCGKLVGLITRNHLQDFLANSRRYKQPGLLQIITESFYSTYNKYFS